MKNHFENVLVSDPLKIKRYESPYYKTVYSICVLIPVLLAFAVTFFLIFFMSPRGRNMRQYQREIYDWNKEDLALKMDQLSFAFKINPYINPNWTKQSMLIMEHHDNPAYNEEEQALHNLLSYKQSYFWFNNTDHIFPVLNLTNKTAMPYGDSEEYCLHLWWSPQSRDKTYPDQYASVLDQPLCENSRNASKYTWDSGNHT